MGKHKSLIIEVLPYFKVDAQFQTPQIGEMAAMMIDLNRLTLTMKDKPMKRSIRTSDTGEIINNVIKGCGGKIESFNACF